MSLAAIGANLKESNALAVKADATAQAGQTGQGGVLAAIKRAAAKTGVDFAYLVKKAETESSLNPTAQAKGSSARGLYQFINSTWLDTLDKHGAEAGRADLANAITRRADGSLTVSDPAMKQKILALRDDPELSAHMAAALDGDNADSLKAKLGTSKVSGTDLYMAHFLGAGGAGQLLGKLKNCPNAPACSVVPEAAAANRSVFYTAGGRAKSVAEVYQHFSGKFGEGAVATASASPIQSRAALLNMLPAMQANTNTMAALSGLGSTTGDTSGLPVASAFTTSGVAQMASADTIPSKIPGLFDTAFSSSAHLRDTSNSLFYQLMIADTKQATSRI